MKVLHFCSYYRPFGGAERLLFSVLDLLESRGVTNVVVAPGSQSEGATGKRAEHFVDFLEYPFGRSDLLSAALNNRRLMRSISRIVADERPDVIHLHNQQNPFVYLGCLRTGIPLVRNVHDPRLYCPTSWRLLPDRSHCPHPFGRACLTEGCIGWTPAEVKNLAATIFNRRLSFRNTTLIVESREAYELARQNGYPDDRLAFIPNFTKLRPIEVERAEKERHSDPNRRRVLFVGRASYEKGLHLLLRAMARARSGFQLHVLTSGDYYQQKVAPLVEELGLQRRVEARFDSTYEETARYYSMADVVVVPSVWFETFCLVGIEAMARMTPVIATRTGGIKDWCADGETGLLVDVFDEAALAGAIDRLLENPELRRRMGENGYRRVAALYNEDHYFERLEALYRKVANHGEAGSDRFARMAGRAV
jgi:glycosyltransferase involved in cell wall biosynthesis